MIWLWIIFGIAPFFAILLSFSITVYVKITDVISVSIGAYGYKFALDMDKKQEEAAKKVKEKKLPKAKKVKNAAPKGKKPRKADEKSFSESLEFGITIIKSIVPNSVAMLKHIKITSLRLYMTVASDQADKTAILYGAISAGIYNLLGVLDNTFKLKIKSVDIVPDFVTDEAVYDIYFKIKLRLCHIIFALIGIIVTFIGNTFVKSNNIKPIENKEKAVQSHE